MPEVVSYRSGDHAHSAVAGGSTSDCLSVCNVTVVRHIRRLGDTTVHVGSLDGRQSGHVFRRAWTWINLRKHLETSIAELPALSLEAQQICILLTGNEPGERSPRVRLYERALRHWHLIYKEDEVSTDQTFIEDAVEFPDWKWQVARTKRYLPPEKFIPQLQSHRE